MYNKLLAIKKDLANYKRDKDILLAEAINTRLNKCTETYLDIINQKTNYLNDSDTLYLAKRIGRELI